jgi:hypothetical protein
MMTERVFRTLGPFPLDADLDVLSWLARESAERACAAEGFELVEHVEREVPVAELPAKTVKHAVSLGMDPNGFLWVEQITTGRVNQPVWDWLIAECAWRGEQLKLWVAAERNWKAANAPVL